MTESRLCDAMETVLSALSVVPTDVALHSGLTDADGLAYLAQIAEGRRYLDAQAALMAGVFARRSAPELGGDGLAQKMGKRTPIELVKSITGLTGSEAATAVRVGTLALDAAADGQVDESTGEVFTAAEPWMRVVVAGVTAGTISVHAADAIRAGAGRPTESVTAVMLAGIVERAVEFAATSDVDRVLRFTKDLRDQVDAAGVAEREAQRYADRAWRFTIRPDGSAMSIIQHDIVGAALMKDLYDRTTSPKLPRFVDLSEEVTEGEAPVTTPADATFGERRRRDQNAYDALMGFVMAGAETDPSRMLGTTGARITVLVTKDQLEADTGMAFIDGQADPISTATVRALIADAGCRTSIEPVVFDEHGRPLEITVEQRLFSLKQKIILTAMFGGCAFDGCDRPASWTEAHHIEWVKRDRGKTSISNGILLCRHHHLLLHNEGWEIRRSGVRGEEYWLVPPASVDPARTPRPIKFKSRAYQQLRAAAPRAA